MVPFKSFASCMILPAVLVASAFAQAPTGDVAARSGLERLWTTALRVDPARAQVESVQARGGLILVQTSAGTVQALDAETGQSFWAVGVGKPEYPTMPPGSNANHVGVTNGTTLYLLDRKTGGIVWQQRLGGSPCAGCALTDKRIFVPLDSGLIESYPLARSGLVDQIPERFIGGGGAVAAPMIISDRVIWGVSKGYVYSSEQGEKPLEFRYRLDDDLTAPPAYMSPYVFAASRNGSVYALQEKSGVMIWQFAGESSISHPLVAIDGALYSITESAEMFRLNPRTGAQLWYARGIARFLAASSSRLYALDLSGRMVVIDAASGARLTSMPVGATDLSCINTETDRIYFGAAQGTLNCYREMQHTAPMQHTPGYAVPPPKTETETPAATTTENPTM